MSKQNQSNLDILKNSLKMYIFDETILKIILNTNIKQFLVFLFTIILFTSTISLTIFKTLIQNTIFSNKFLLNLATSFGMILIYFLMYVIGGFLIAYILIYILNLFYKKNKTTWEELYKLLLFNGLGQLIISIPLIFINTFLYFLELENLFLQNIHFIYTSLLSIWSFMAFLFFILILNKVKKVDLKKHLVFGLILIIILELSSYFL